MLLASPAFAGFDAEKVISPSLGPTSYTRIFFAGRNWVYTDSGLSLYIWRRAPIQPSARSPQTDETTMTSQREDQLSEVRESDREVYDLIRSEEDRQEKVIRLIASENYASRAVMQATGSVFTNKYSEGYPGRRYYQGQEFTDKVENLAKERGKELFGAEHVNVQPYSGSPANLEVYYALCDVGDPILGMGLPYGGHLTHGWKVNFSGRFFDAHHYAVDEDTELLDYDAILEKAREVQPKLLLCGASAYPRTIDFEKFADIADEVGAYMVADIAHISGLVAGGAHPSPVGVADVVTSTTHKTLRGPRGGLIMCKEEHAKSIDRAVFPALQGGPHMHAVAALAVAFQEALRPEFEDYAHQVVRNAKAMADAFQEAGYRLVSGGTDNHLLLVDVNERGIGGKAAATALCDAGIVCNANSIPYDTRGPFDPSGIRIGTPSLTTRGMGEDEMHQVVGWIDDVLSNIDDDDVIANTRSVVEELCSDFPVPY
jgi:glycine hydroxymethyltransferase